MCFRLYQQPQAEVCRLKWGEGGVLLWPVCGCSWLIARGCPLAVGAGLHPWTRLHGVSCHRAPARAPTVSCCRVGPTKQRSRRAFSVKIRGLLASQRKQFSGAEETPAPADQTSQQPALRGAAHSLPTVVARGWYEWLR